MTQNIYYVYFYLRTDGSPYYVGKGKNGRAQSTQKRVRKPPESWRIVFPEKDLDEFDAFCWERFWIEFYGRKDLVTGILHNQTNGGEGVSGLRHSEKAKAKQAKSARNRTDAQNKRAGAPKKGKAPWNKGRKETREDVLENQRNGQLNKTEEEKEEIRKKNADGHRGKTHSEATKKQMSEAKKGRVAHNKGKKMPIITCPHCNKSGGSSGMKKYHFDRCKFKLT